MSESENIVTKSVNLTKIVQPSYLTLTKSPANEAGFRVVRRDLTGDSVVSTESGKRKVTRTKRSALLYVSFPAEATDESIAALAAEYGITDFVVVEEDGVRYLKRADLPSVPDDALVVSVPGGHRIGVLRSTQDVVETSGIAVVGYGFPDDKFTQAQREDYLSKMGATPVTTLSENGVTRVYCTDKCPEDTRTMIVDGVSLMVTRAEVASIPVPLYEVVSETAYGNWGWGQLDFNAMMADVEFSNATDDAIYRLRKVMDQILLYSELPLSIRKELVNRACNQFAGYIGALIDGLPTQVVIAARSSVENRKENEMSGTKPQAGVAAVAAAAPADAPATDAPITRADVQEIVATAIAAALAKRTDEAPAPAVDPAPTEPVEKDVESVVRSALAPLQEALATLATSMTGVAQGVETLGTRVAGIEGATVVRSDGVDSASTAPKDPFVGLFK